MRGKKAPKREVQADRIYQSTVVTKLINYVMRDGKKSIAEKIVYGAMDKVKKIVKKDDILDVLEKAIENVGPKVELRSRRVGGANYQVPIPVSKDRRITLALRWIVGAARDKKGQRMIDKLAKEIVDAYNNTGDAVQKRQNLHKMAEANKAFAIFRW
uniref:Small ribosomal subunit protein uS7 n=1 Tax=candidate division CPR3 bacterium TaxID=2268181 RepID=A0A7C5YXR2_UNCC3